MKTFGNLWKPVNTYGNLWKPFEKLMETYENLWKTFEQRNFSAWRAEQIHGSMNRQLSQVNIGGWWIDGDRC